MPSVSELRPVPDSCRCIGIIGILWNGKYLLSSWGHTGVSNVVNSSLSRQYVYCKLDNCIWWNKTLGTGQTRCLVRQSAQIIVPNWKDNVVHPSWGSMSRRTERMTDRPWVAKWSVLGTIRFSINFLLQAAGLMEQNFPEGIPRHVLQSSGIQLLLKLQNYRPSLVLFREIGIIAGHPYIDY
jgi:hypothetical protein